MTNYAATERAALVETLRNVGDDAPTLCEGWTTRDLALHLIERDSRPDIFVGKAAPKIPLLGSRARDKHAELAALPFNELIDKIATPAAMAPARVGAVDKRMNTVEFFIHHEDVRRAHEGWQARPLPVEHETQLWNSLSLMRPVLLRKHEDTVVLVAEGHGSLSGGKGKQSRVRIVRGLPSELFLWAYGREDQAQVEISEY